MKRVFFILIMLLPAQSFSQETEDLDFPNQIITTSLKLYSGEIVKYEKKTLEFNPASSETVFVPADSIRAIRGKIPRKITWLLSFDYGGIVHDNTLIYGNITPELLKELSMEGETISEDYQPAVYSKSVLRSNTENKLATEKTSGELISQAASLRLTSLGIAAATGLLASTYTVDENNADNVTTVLVVGGIASLVFYVAGEFTQIRAGKLMIQENFVLHSTDAGIGLALKF